MAAKPSVIPELFSGDKSWDDWIYHFESVAEVCGWDTDNKLKWLRVRLTGRAGQTFKRLPDDVRASYDNAKAALKRRFEPESQKTLYQMKLQTRLKQNGESWAEFGEDLKTLAERAYPNLVDEAKEQFALNQYLAQLTNPQVAFAVKQTRPTTIDDAVQATLEMESYSKRVSSGIAQVTEDIGEDTGAVAVAAARVPNDVKMLLEKMDRMETQMREMQLQQSTPRRGQVRRNGGQQGSKECWNCGGQGHLARYCPSPKLPRESQGNERPPVL